MLKTSNIGQNACVQTFVKVVDSFVDHCLWQVTVRRSLTYDTGGRWLTSRQKKDQPRFRETLHWTLAWCAAGVFLSFWLNKLLNKVSFISIKLYDLPGTTVSIK